ncbi:MAG: TolC family protein, partial [Cyclobacteriaceae bacterium]
MKGLLISALIILLVHNSWAQDANPMTLQECIEYALQNNELGKIASLEKELAAKEVKKTIGSGLPQVEINSGINYNYEVQQAIIPSFTDPSRDTTFAFTQAYDGNIALSVRQLIFDGSFFVGLEASKTYQELSSKEHIKTQIDIVEAVSKAYYYVLINEERLELVQKN